MHERIADQILQMLQPARAHVEQREEQQPEPATAVVAAEAGARGAETLEPAQIPPHEFEVVR